MHTAATTDELFIKAPSQNANAVETEFAAVGPMTKLTMNPEPMLDEKTKLFQDNKMNRWLLHTCIAESA